MNSEIIFLISLAIGLIIIVNIAKFINRKIIQHKEIVKFEKQQKIRQEQRAQILQQQQNLIQQYANSDLLIQILNYICKGNYTSYKPREIIINHDNIQSDFSDHRITYDFLSNRVPLFKTIWASIGDNPVEEVLVRPQVAMAEAINYLMDNNYNIYDKAKWTSQKVQHDDTHCTYLYHYESNYVLMQLKATKQF